MKTKTERPDNDTETRHIYGAAYCFCGATAYRYDPALDKYERCANGHDPMADPPAGAKVLPLRECLGLRDNSLTRPHDRAVIGLSPRVLTDWAKAVPPNKTALTE
jgi:hypothetical protein